MKQSVITAPITRVAAATSRDQDFIAVEEPLQIRLNGTDLAITMRTPGHDPELAAGFLFTEGILPNREAIASYNAKVTRDGVFSDRWRKFCWRSSTSSGTRPASSRPAHRFE